MYTPLHRYTIVIAIVIYKLITAETDNHNNSLEYKHCRTSAVKKQLNVTLNDGTNNSTNDEDIDNNDNNPRNVGK